MRFTIYLNPQTPGPGHDGRIISEVLGQVDLAEKLGFDECWLTEHHFTGYNAYSDPLMLASAISQRNPSLGLGFSIAILPLHNPIRFLTQAHILHQLSKGKFTIGIGPGNSAHEFNGFGEATDERQAMMKDFLKVMDAAWANDGSGFSFDSPYFKGKVEGRIIPEPFAGATPHVAWGTNTDANITECGRRGWSMLWAPHLLPATIGPKLRAWVQGMDEAGLSAEQRAKAWGNSGYMRQIYVAEPGEDWKETLEPYLRNYTASSMFANFGRVLDDPEEFETRKNMFRDRWLFAGTADELVERLAPYARMGIGHVMCWFTFGYLPDEMVKRSIVRFASDVIPRLRAIAADPAYVDELIGTAPAGTSSNAGPGGYRGVL